MLVFNCWRDETIIIPTQPEKSCVNSFCVHLLRARMYVCVSSWLRSGWQEGQRVKRKRVFLIFQHCFKDAQPPQYRQFPSGRWGQRPPVRPSITRCVMWGSLYFISAPRASSAGLLTERSVSGTSLHQTQAPRAHRPAQECTALFSAAVIWLQELGWMPPRDEKHTLPGGLPYPQPAWASALWPLRAFK